jgi:hypothetical protein
MRFIESTHTRRDNVSTVLETLQNAQINLVVNLPYGFTGAIGKSQLTNAVTLLEKGYGLYDDVDALIDKYGDVVNVPEKGENDEG